MNIQVPAIVFSRPLGSMTATWARGEVVLFVRETEWGLKRYPPACRVELRLWSWEIDNVPLVALVLRFARSDCATFDCHLDVQTPAGLRMLQGLASQSQIDVHLVADQTIRTFRVANPAPEEAARLVDKVRARKPSSADDVERAMARLNQLYPTARDLWWNGTRCALS